MASSVQDFDARGPTAGADGGTFDVVVIGAGPAGSMAAYEVARAGRSCLLLERGEAPGARVACGGGVMGFAGSSGLLAAIPSRTVRRFDVYLPGRHQVLETSVQKVLMIPRPRLDAHLAQAAVRAGAVLCTQARALRIDPRRRLVEVRHGPSGATRTYGGRFIVAADGPDTLARSAGVGFRAGRFNRAVGIADELESADDPMTSADLVLSDAIPWGYFWIFPHGSHLNVGVYSLCGAHEGSLRSALDRFIEGDPRLRGRRRMRSLAGVIPLRPAVRLQSGGVLAAGDAAGLVNPFTGAGIHHAMLSGQIAGRSCVAALRRGSSRCFYGPRLALGATYLWLQALSGAAGAVLVLSRLVRRPLYASVLRAMMADHEVVYRIAAAVR